MKVKELIEILQTLNPDDEVSIINNGSKTDDTTNWLSWTDDERSNKTCGLI